MQYLGFIIIFRKELDGETEFKGTFSTIEQAQKEYDRLIQLYNPNFIRIGRVVISLVSPRFD